MSSTAGSSAATEHNLRGDLWGGLAAMLVALPSAIAFGVTILAPLGPQFGAQGAIAGLIGVTILGLLAALLGGTRRLISAPSAPAAAVISALAIELVHQGHEPASILLILFLVAVCSSLLQIMLGAFGIGQLIRYMPFPVVSGYLSGVGLIIIASQLPKLLGAPAGTDWFNALLHPADWSGASLLIGATTMAMMVVATCFPSRNVPAVIQGLAAGVIMYWLLALTAFPSLASLDHNSFVIGRFDTGSGSILESMVAAWDRFGAAPLPHWEQVIIPALTLAVLLSIDTLKTCLVLDAMSGTRHDSNRELIGQGLGNLASTLFGGTPGSGTMGASLVNRASGGMTKMSGVFAGIWSMLAFLVLTPLLCWLPVAALAGLLLVIGFRMIDWHLFHLARSRVTLLDFVVIISVVVVAKMVGLIAASALGVVLAILMFIREQIHSSTIRHKSRGDVIFSKRVRSRKEREALREHGASNLIVELQGSLFFGNTDALYRTLEPDLEKARYLILDFQRVQSIDMTAAHMLDRVRAQLSERGATLLLSRLPFTLPTGRNLRGYLKELGVTHSGEEMQIFDDFADALEWVEEQTLRALGVHGDEGKPLKLEEFELFSDMQPTTLAALQRCVHKRFYEAGETIFIAGTPGDTLMLISHGSVRIDLLLEEARRMHMATFGRGQFFGEMSFLDHHPHSADVTAVTDTELLILPRPGFDRYAAEDPVMASHVFASLSRALADRLRHTNEELRSLEST